jgi:hypothetical protein
MTTYKFVSAGVLMLIFTIVTLAPSLALAQTQTAFGYQPRTQSEMIAYLYGRIAQLIEIKEMLERGGTVSAPVQIPIQSASATTRSATDITATTAILRGEVNLYGGVTARVWFEYGREQDFLDQKTSQVTVRSAYDRAVRVQVRTLRDDTRYYFRIVSQDNRGVLNYGPIFSFRTNEAR